ncbi:putative quinol monooxygenase [Lactobacillus corticis]|uniref:Antibiotic biosynthesis monooxygenase n=1 Tax=Lactobacillus corticis TaxID=2201249 RepID=A0A916QID6_9LACO|nr:putative quinol monooxygenase [Lactobacillus corticis]GFZ27534.1 antibiotic biosynthesis monooxygenase [Lactobacillus corticis]
MSLIVNLYYTGKPGAAQAFVKEMEASGCAERIRQEAGNERYDYFQPLNDPDTILLIDQWADQASLDRHHASPMMQELADLREKYDLHMRVERMVPANDAPGDEKFLRK